MTRRLASIFAALALVLPAAAGALGRGSGEGTLAVDNAQGSIVLRVRGGIIGQFDQGGTIDVVDLSLGGGPPPTLKGCEQKTLIAPRRWECTSTASEVRFWMNGLYRVRIDANGIDLGVHGRGVAALDGSGFSDQTGTYALNGGSYQAFPDTRTQVFVGTPPPATLGSK